MRDRLIHIEASNLQDEKDSEVRLLTDSAGEEQDFVDSGSFQTLE